MTPGTARSAVRPGGRRFAAAAFSLGLLAGCGALEPYPTAPLLAPAGGPPGQRVAICYNTLNATLAEIQAAAQQECPADTVAEPADTDYRMQNCPLLLPGRATYRCAPKK
jgi:hypothetical protein